MYSSIPYLNIRSYIRPIKRSLNSIQRFLYSDSPTQVSSKHLESEALLWNYHIFQLNSIHDPWVQSIVFSQSIVFASNGASIGSRGKFIKLFFVTSCCGC